MRKSLSIVLAAALIMVFLVSCSNGTTSQSTPTSSTTKINLSDTTSFTAYTDPTQPINVSANQEFVLALESNPTTGYDWHESFDESALKLIEMKYQAKQTASPMVGSGGTDYFHFQTLKTGTTKIILTYYRGWETPLATDKTETFTINVK